jgi:ABC-type phosphate transport system substrate-binding protein
MIRQRVSLAVAGAVVATTALTTGLVAPASAAPDSPYDPDFTPSTSDLVGVGSDTIEIVMHDVANAFNKTATASTGQLASFAAGPANTQITLRSGSASIARPNGSGAGKNLLHATTNNPDVSFARSSSTLSSTEISDGLKQFAFAVDGLKLAVSANVTTNAPSTITADDMVKIYKGTYTTWGQIPGYDGTAPNATIKPFVPQSGSGTLSFFTTQLQAANGGVAVTLAGSVKVSQEHDSTLVKNDPDAIAPFSTARAKGDSSVKLVRGFAARRAVYNVVRGSDIATTTAGSLGAKLLAVFGPAGYLCSPAAKPVIEAAGFDQLATSATPGGQCGVAQSTAVSYPYVTSSVVTTETSLSATTSDSNVTLTATVDGNDTAAGTVTFKDGADVTVGTAPVNGQSKATLTLTGVPSGTKTYTATYTPKAGSNFQGSSAPATSVNVAAPSTGVAASTVTVGSVAKTYGVTGALPISVSAKGAPAAGTVSVDIGGVVTRLVLRNGAAVASVPATLAAGSHRVAVTYTGATDVAASSATGSVTVAKAKTASTLKLSKKTIKAGKKAKATITVKISGSSLRANGKVTVKAGSKVIGKGTVKNGKVTITLKKLKKGKFTIKATFAGGANYGPSASKTVKLKVTK